MHHAQLSATHGGGARSLAARLFWGGRVGPGALEGAAATVRWGAPIRTFTQPSLNGARRKRPGLYRTDVAPSRKTPRSHKTLFPLWLARPQRAGPAMRRCPGGSVGARMCRLRIYGLRIAVRSKLLLCTRYPRVTHCCTVPRSAGSAALFERDSRDCDAVLHPCASAPCGSVGDRIRSVRICWLQLARAAPAHTLRARHALPHRPAKQEALRRLNATAV